MKRTFKPYLRLGPQAFDSGNALLKPHPAFVHRHLESVEFLGEEGAGETGVEASVGQTVEHGQLGGQLDRVVKGRQHRPGYQPGASGALGNGGEKNDRARGVATVAAEVVLDGANVLIP